MARIMFLRGYAIAVDKIQYVTEVGNATEECSVRECGKCYKQQYTFLIQFDGDEEGQLIMRYATRFEADYDWDLLVKEWGKAR